MAFKQIIVVCIFCFVSTIGSAQPQPQNPQGDPDVVPLTGIEYLVLAGGAYGISRLRKKKIRKP